MALSYDTLVADKNTRGSIKSWVNASSFDPIGLLEEAETHICNQLRVREMITITTPSAMVIGTPTLALPDRWRGSLSFQITGTDQAVIELHEPADVEAAFQYDSDGNRVDTKPLSYYAAATLIHFDSPPDKTYATRMVHYQAPLPLDAGNPTNFLTARYPRMLRCACMWLANEWMKDDAEKNYWATITQGLIDEANQEADLDRMGLIADTVLV